MSEHLKIHEITTARDLDYLKLLARQFPNIATASTEIINLSAILNLPKGTEHFISDIHGEWESFNHVIRNASGVIRAKIDDIFGRGGVPEIKGDALEVSSCAFAKYQLSALR